MGNSIQDYLKKINSRLTWSDCVSLLVTCFFLVGFSTYLHNKKEKEAIPVTYTVNNNGNDGDKRVINDEDFRPFASNKGKTYTFSWCQGSNIISAQNKIYFNSEEDAQKSGRTLSKLCK